VLLLDSFSRQRAFHGLEGVRGREELHDEQIAPKSNGMRRDVWGSGKGGSRQGGEMGSQKNLWLTKHTKGGERCYDVTGGGR